MYKSNCTLAITACRFCSKMDSAALDTSTPQKLHVIFDLSSTPSNIKMRYSLKKTLLSFGIHNKSRHLFKSERFLSSEAAVILILTQFGTTRCVLSSSQLLARIPEFCVNTEKAYIFKNQSGHVKSDLPLKKKEWSEIENRQFQGKYSPER